MAELKKMEIEKALYESQRKVEEKRSTILTKMSA